MPFSLTTWIRLEPHARSAGLEGGVHAAIHDPLWLLARQWQLGEFHGEDAGSPVQAHLNLTCTRLTRYSPCPLPLEWRRADGRIREGVSVTGQRLETAIPLETLVERERVHIDGDLQPQPRLAAEAGQHFLRMLETRGCGTHRTFLLKEFPLQTPADIPDSFDAETCRFLQVVAGRVPDGGLIHSILRTIQGREIPGAFSAKYRTLVETGVVTWDLWKLQLSDVERPIVTEIEDRWLEWYESLFSEPSTLSNPAWTPERMEYAALVAAPLEPEGEVVLSIPEYSEGHLDWYSFNILPKASLGAARTDLSKEEQEAEEIKFSATPAPVSYKGMPASRYWEMEDASIDFGALTAGPLQLARLLLMDFALVAGDDWFLLPVAAPVGSLCRTNWLVVEDTFGVSTLIPSARTVDGIPGHAHLPWDMFALACDTRALSDRAPEFSEMLFLPPTLGASLAGTTLEEVLFLRDEMANLAWAVERVVENPIGRPRQRSEMYFRSRQEKIPQSGASVGQAAAWPVYQLRTEIPEHWMPLTPTRISQESPSIRLVPSGRWQGRILVFNDDHKHEENDLPPGLYEEEVPREGALVSRAFQYTRWTDGQTYLWMARRKGAGRGEGSSGLRFDVLDGNV